MDVWAASLFFVSPTDQRGQDKAIGLHKHSLKDTLECNAPPPFPSRLMHKGTAHCKMSLAVIFIIWFIRCQKSTYASQAARVKKPSRIVVQQIVAHILPTISFNNPFEVQEGRKWNFNDIANSPPPFSSYHTYFTTLKSNAYSPNFLLLQFSCHHVYIFLLLTFSPGNVRIL